MTETIVALSTPPGVSGLAVIRLSGPACADVARDCLGRSTCKPRMLHTASFRDPENGRVLDALAFHLLPGPASPTGEDVLEIFPHGNPLILEALLRVLLRHPGVRAAEPGEFTRRAFENGRIDLVQAEAVGELVHAQSRAALDNARRMLSGELSEQLRGLRDQLLDLSARVELDADFAEEEADPDYVSWLPRVTGVRREVERLLAGYERGKDWNRAARAAVFGAPNAGKSSLINALTGRDRLLVSDIAGTTRDFVDVPLRLAGGIAHLVDTAGIGLPADALDALAMERARAQIGEADLRVYVADGTGAVDEVLARDADLRVLTKRDLPGFAAREGFFAVSSRTGEGLDALLDALEKRLRPVTDAGEGVVVATARQHAALEKARDRLLAAEAHLSGKHGAPAVEILAFEIREACTALRELLGDVTADDVLHRLFAGFCIGK